MHAVITGCAFSQTAPDFSGRIQLSNYSSLDTSQFCALLDYFRGKDITEIGGGCGHFAWTMLALGAKSVTSYDENPPEAFPPGHPRITQQLKELGWEFIQKDLGHGLTPEVTEHLVVAWPTPPDDTTIPSHRVGEDTAFRPRSLLFGKKWPGQLRHAKVLSAAGLARDTGG
jgi:hypothetical protein